LIGRLSGIRTQSGQTNWEERRPCPIFASYTLAFALQLRIKHGKTSVRVAKPQSFHENWQSERHTLLKGINESFIVFSALFFQFVSNLEGKMFTKCI